MTSYFISAIDLQKLHNQKFSIRDRNTGEMVQFHILEPERGWPRGGVEAYGILTQCQHPSKGRIPSFLKIFKQDIPERTKRTEFLINLGLAKHHPWLFQGMPYAALLKTTLNGVTIVGHIARQVVGKNGKVGEDIARLRTNSLWNYSWEERKRLAGHLCCAVFALEKLGVVHGDISPRNIMVGIAPDGQPAAILCDFDGFFHPSQPLLPVTFEKKFCRPVGSEGYQYPKLVEDMAAGKQDIYVETDRFALAVLVCEIMLWSDSVAVVLGRSELLDNDIVKTRSFRKIPKELVKSWRDGFALLEKAVNARNYTDMPSPSDWLRLLQSEPPTVKQFKHRPYIKIRKRNGNTLRTVIDVHLKNLKGNLGTVHTDLSLIEFDAPPGHLYFHIKWATPIYLLRGGDQFDLGKGPRILSVQSGDIVTSNYWEFEVFDVS